MGRVVLVAWAVVLACAAAFGRNDDDFAFESNEEFQVELTANHSEITRNGLKKLWGVPDATAYAEHLFRMEIPREAFTGEVSAYKVRTENGEPVPSWMAVDSRHGLISGVPQSQDVGTYILEVTAHGKTHGLTASDTFSVHVKRATDKTTSKYGSCSLQQKRLLAAIVIDRPLGRITSKQRIKAMMGLANFLAVDGDEFHMAPYKVDTQNQQTILSGAGDSRGRREAKDGFTGIYWNVGCAEALYPHHKVIVAGLREQARDGTITQVLHLPVAGWRLLAMQPAPRVKRQSDLEEGSGGYDDNYDGEDDYSGDYDDTNDDDDYTRINLPPDNVGSSPAPHPHRHHHGEATDSHPPTDPTHPPTETTQLPIETTQLPTETPQLPTKTTQLPTTSTQLPITIRTTVRTLPPSPVTLPLDPESSDRTSAEITDDETTISASTKTYTTENHVVQITPYSESASEANSIVNMTILPEEIAPRRLAELDSPIVIVPEEMTTSTEAEQTVIILAANELHPPPSSEPSSTMVASPSPTTEVQSTTPKPTTRNTTPTTTPVPTTTPTVPTTTPMTPKLQTTTPTLPPVTNPSTTLQVTTPIVLPETTTEEEDVEVEVEEEEEVTEKESQTSTERTSTIIGRTTETVTFAMPVNQPPTLNHHMKKLAITAGKAFRYIIPADLFTDPEDGTNLTFSLYVNDNKQLSPDSWVQFIPTAREVYGLPLDKHVSRYSLAVEARDSSGAAARGPLDVTVQQHRTQRTVHHQFILQFRLNAPYSNTVDWQIRALEGIVNLFRDTDMDHLTVLNATQQGDMCEFVWTNDTLPRDGECPREDINRLMAILESPPGSPSPPLIRAMLPQLKVSSVSWRGLGQCAVKSTDQPVDKQLITYPPVTRNQVDHITATVGQLLAYKVQEDTFFDPEDGGTRNLKLSLRRGDRSPLPADHWLQFDENNQEFYGLPLQRDEGPAHYQLIAEDSSKKSAYDSLIVEVVKAPTIRPTVEFQMTMEYPFESLAHSAANKRKVVEKLAALFGQSNTDSIRIKSITDNPTTIIWYNTSLPMDRCPKKEIETLRHMIINDERGTETALKHVVDQIFDKDFNVMAIRLVPLGLCSDQVTKVPKQPAPPPPPAAPHAPSSDSGYSEYIVTYIVPAVVVVCMIVAAVALACLLHRRRRTGKMSVGDEEERQAFRSKGIPVIFQDELEERTDSEPVHKSPVIMREEKPPLLPPAPDYRGSEDAPYRPPPPFASSRTPPRPKATPTYRKPPPYVPP